MPTLEDAFRWVITVVFGTILFYVVGIFVEANVRTVFEDRGWDKLLDRAISRGPAFIRKGLTKMWDLRSYRSFWFGFGLVAGVTLLMWIFPIIQAASLPPIVSKEKERKSVQAPSASTSFSDQQRFQFEKAMRWRIATDARLINLKARVYADTSNSLKANMFVDMLLATGWTVMRDSVGSFVLRPDFNITPGITIRPTSVKNNWMAWAALRESLSQANILFSDASSTHADAVQIEIGK
jgi:hypothetical protein